MARHQTYGERMAEWEREQDERNWKISLDTALEHSDMSLVEELIKEGLFSDYSFTSFHNNNVVSQILDKFVS